MDLTRAEHVLGSCYNFKPAWRIARGNSGERWGDNLPPERVIHAQRVVESSGAKDLEATPSSLLSPEPIGEEWSADHYGGIKARIGVHEQGTESEVVSQGRVP